MPVDSTAPEYTKAQNQWTRVRDTISGVDAVKAKGGQYLPRPSAHDSDDYAGYKMRAEFYPATRRTLDGLAGAIFRKDPRTVVPPKFGHILERLTLQGHNFTTFAKKVGREIVSIGRYGLLVDIRDDTSEPYVSGYVAETIINWRTTLVDGLPKLSLVVLHEQKEQAKKDDPYETELIDVYRVLTLGPLDPNDSNSPNVYQVRAWRKADKTVTGKDEWILLEEGAPQRRGQYLDFIPFYFLGAQELGPGIGVIPLLDLADTNLSHYRTSAELEEGAYFTGLPMYVISGRPIGHNEDAGAFEFKVGSRNALILSEEGSAEVLTVSGEGMGLLKDLLDSKEKRMAVLGARLLEDQKAGVEAEGTVTLRHRGETSLLASISVTISAGLKQMLQTMVWWAGDENPEVEVELNKDFLGTAMSPKEIVEMTAALQQGSIGPQVMFNALQEGERLPDGWSFDDWIDDINKGASSFERELNNEAVEE